MGELSKNLNKVEDKNIKVLVTGDGYMSDDDGMVHAIYKGEKTEVMMRIAENHGYGVDEEEDPSLNEICNGVEDSNGDGCDYIAITLIGENKELIRLL